VCVCPQHNSKTNDHKVFKLGIGELRFLELLSYAADKNDKQRESQSDKRTADADERFTPATVIGESIIWVGYISIPSSTDGRNFKGSGDVL